MFGLVYAAWPRRYRPLMKRIEQEQAAVWQQVPDADKAMVAKRGTFGGRNVYGPLLVLLKADKLAVLVRLAVLVKVWTRGHGIEYCATRAVISRPVHVSM